MIDYLDLNGNNGFNFGVSVCKRFFQVEASTNQASDHKMQLYDLPSKILCRVMNVELKVFPLLEENYWFLFVIEALLLVME